MPSPSGMPEERLGGIFLSLPYWDSHVDMEVASWFPLGVDFCPVSINSLFSSDLEMLASRALSLGSEFYCMSSLRSGNVGSLLRDSMLFPGSDTRLDLGFTMVFGYSAEMERIVESALGAYANLSAGVSSCRVWDRDMPREEFKAIVLVSPDPFFDEEAFLVSFSRSLEAGPCEKEIPFYAEHFGYVRFFIPFETDNLQELQISRLLHEMENEETRKSVGPSPEIRFPRFPEIRIER